MIIHQQVFDKHLSKTFMVLALKVKIFCCSLIFFTETLIMLRFGQDQHLEGLIYID